MSGHGCEQLDQHAFERQPRIKEIQEDGGEVGVSAGEQQFAEALNLFRGRLAARYRTARGGPVAVSEHEPWQNLRLDDACELTAHSGFTGLIPED
ncbi:methionine-tRNA ligase [Methylorubrum populi]|uniref:Methionine-tRNA ligase n=1 Tax=Methylorubrum populi TaxID=223967 RepID=A0A160PME3_9HYPH|nr:methionine-tRNA ligase [Methylorubrum populi]